MLCGSHCDIKTIPRCTRTSGTTISHGRVESPTDHVPQRFTHRYMNAQSIIPPYGGIQYHNLVSPDNHTPSTPIAIPPATDVTLNIPADTTPIDAAGTSPNNVESVPSDQPDVEPIPPSVAPVPESKPVEVPVREDDDDDDDDDDESLFVQPENVFHVE